MLVYDYFGILLSNSSLLILILINRLGCVAALAGDGAASVIVAAQGLQLVLEDLDKAVEDKVWLAVRIRLLDVLVEIAEC